MKFNFSFFVVTTIFVILSVTSAIPLSHFVPDGPHPVLKGSGLSIAGSGKRSHTLDTCSSDADNHDCPRGSVWDFKNMECVIGVSTRSSHQQCPKEWLLENGHCFPKIITTRSSHLQCPKEYLLENGHCVPEVVHNPITRNNDVKPVGYGIPICNEDLSVQPCILNYDGPVGAPIDTSNLPQCEETLRNPPPVCVFNGAGVHALGLHGRDFDTDLNARDVSADSVFSSFKRFDIANMRPL